MTVWAFVVLAWGCKAADQAERTAPLGWSAWIEDAAVQRGRIEPGDVAQFGCPPGWMGVDDTTFAVSRPTVSATFRGTAAPPRNGTVTCIAQREFSLPPAYPTDDPVADARHRPMSPVSLEVEADRTTIVFARDLPPHASVYIGQDTPCGPRVMGVRLGDLLKWLADPHHAGTRDFLGMVSAGCPDLGWR